MRRYRDQFARTPLYLVFDLHRSFVEGLPDWAEMRCPFKTDPFLFRYNPMEGNGFFDPEAEAVGWTSGAHFKIY